MDSFMQMNEHRGGEMDELVSQPAWEESEINTTYPIQPEPLLVESQPGAAKLRDRMNAERTMRTARYRSRMDLRPALIRGRGLAEKCTKAGSQKKMGKRRQNVSEYYGFESGLRGKQTLPRRISLGKFMKEAERIKKESERIEAKELKREFLRAEFSTKVLETGYVMANWYECLRKIELIRRAKGLESRLSSDEFAPVKQKLEAVEEYANVVDSVLWQSGWRIDFNTYRIVAINENDEEFARRRQAYLANGAWRFYVGVKRYHQISKNEAASSDVHQQGVQRTRVEETLSKLEEELAIFTRNDMRIIRCQMRSVGALRRVGLGDEIRPDKTDAKGKKQYKWVKERIFAIYENLKSELEKEIGTDAKDFNSLERLVLQYVFTNRRPFENRRNAEEKEAKALIALKDALHKLSGYAENKYGKYAAILLGLLTEESSGYLEVPPVGVHVHREDTDITCAKVRCEYEDRTNVPLFTHRPNIKDIEQGGLGDCYLLAGLISIVSQNPEEIMNIMRDNGDGTVTVCFKLEESGERVFTPCYVTVRKTIPLTGHDKSDAYSKGALWVKMMEKAYVASGINLLRKINENRIGNMQAPQKYGDFLIWIQNQKKRLDYDEIEGGLPGQFISLLLGKKSELYPLRIGSNQKGESAAEDENTGQIQDSYYTEEENKLFETIKRELQSGSYVTFGTRQFSGEGTGVYGETKSGGVVGNHAYALMNTQRIEVGGVEHCYVLVMNPWAHKGVVYWVGDQYRVYAVNNEREEGVFLLDLKTFAEVVGYWETVSA